MEPKKPHPTYDSPLGPVKDFVRFLTEDDSPVSDEPFEVGIERTRRSIQEGEDFLVDMGDGSGPRLASVVLEEVANPETWAPMLARINRTSEPKGKTMTAHTADLADKAQTEILRLFRDHQRHTEAASGASDEDTAKQHDNEVRSIEKKMMALPSTCAAGFAAKALALTANGQSFPDWETDPFWIEARALVEQGVPPAIPATRLGRLKFAADTLGLDMPENLKPDLLAEDQSLQDEVLRFCAGSGVSLDFIYFADLKPMLWVNFNRRFEPDHYKSRPLTVDSIRGITEYLDGLQRKAVKARGLLGAIAALGGEPEEEDTLFELVDTATRILSSLDHELDAVSRPAALSS